VNIVAVCPLCAQAANALYANVKWRITPDGRAFCYAYCSACEFAFCEPLPTDSELTEYYTSTFDYNWYARRMRLKRWQAWHRWQRAGKRLEKLVGRRGALLDIGCGHGWFMQAAQRAGWRVSGLDLPGSAIEYAQTQGLDVMQGAAEKINLTRKFDAITLWHTLEHSSNPIQVLKRARDWLNPRGALLIAVPNLQAAGLNRRRASWVWLQQPFVHLWHWSMRALGLTLRQSGFQIIHAETRDTWDAQYLYDAVLNPRWEKQFLASSLRHMSNLAQELGLPISASQHEKIFFTLAESSRLTTYALYFAFGWFARRQAPNAGSELVIIARPDDTINASF
jgi:2-polyprenyl-3-methyl-5-hydroxy-6-metoxy-1,4-benzoquinol methylase